MIFSQPCRFCTTDGPLPALPMGQKLLMFQEQARMPLWQVERPSCRALSAACNSELQPLWQLVTLGHLS